MVETGGSRRSEDAASPHGDESAAVGSAAVPSDPLAHLTSSSHRRGTHAVYRHGEGRHFRASSARGFSPVRQQYQNSG